ncbi:hypothetical protein BK774_03610 [Bacillus thuringiensis]|uniref:Uncharacterized protein n=2 Tax=Bacillus cereus group TaxID=86661 RepID=A0A5B9HX60_BACCE|nr:hypothetical protein BK759_28140 [Bacillus thuringiensis serovar aizawai]OTZ95659.1 hypothetical protein BK774_27920 [Bacillus thuringiensis]QEF20238.1 hypothetical protein FRY47_28480 [Bacillus cereus]OTZ95677.1 hypothetical protein BK774_27900 [Bacillus thuringiensis]OTZ95756.1 hypothetical protein BK774_27890 [Bacillus thuringiensis]
MIFIFLFSFSNLIIVYTLSLKYLAKFSFITFSIILLVIFLSLIERSLVASYRITYTILISSI